MQGSGGGEAALLQQQLTSAGSTADKLAALKQFGLLSTYCGLPPEDLPQHVVQGEEVYVPQNPAEAAALCMLLAFRSSQQSKAQLKDATLWHLAAALGLVHQLDRLAAELQSARRPAGEPAQEGRALALVQLARGQAGRARLSLAKLAESDSVSVLDLLLAVKACLDDGSRDALTAGVSFARRASAAVADQQPAQRARAARALGVALAAGARHAALTPEERAGWRQEALAALQTAAGLDPGDACTRYNLALLQAEARQLDEAAGGARAAVAAAGGSDGAAWALLALVLSAQGQLTQAAATVDGGLAEARPADQALLLTIKARLAEKQGDAPAALRSLAHLMSRLQRAAAAGGEAGEGGLAGQEVELWLDLARVFLTQGAAEDARFCVRQARTASPWHPAVYDGSAKLAMVAGDQAAAEEAWQAALAMDPAYAPASLGLAALYRQRGGQGDLALAQAHADNAVHDAPTCEEAWHQAGALARERGLLSEAERLLRTGVGLALSSPVLPFTKLQYVL